MARPNVFPADTILYSASEPNGRLFPAGETDPGAAWTDKPGGAPVNSASTTAALQDLIAAQDRIETMGETIARNAADLDVAAKAREEAEAKVAGLEQDVIAAKQAQADAEATAQQLTAERDAANIALAAAQARIAALETPAEAQPNEPAPEPAPEADPAA